MFGTIIFILLFLILTITIFLNEKQGIIMYLVFSLLSPNLHLGSVQVSFEILAFFLVFSVLLFKRSKIFSLYKHWPYRQWIWIYFSLIFVSSLIAASKYNSPISWITILGYFRIICIIYMLQYVFRENPEKQLDNILSPILIINFMVSIFQLTVPSSVKIFYDLYYKDSLTPLKEVLNLGHFNRAYGTFGTPVLLGVFALLSFSIYLGYYLEKQPCRFIGLKILLSVSCGLMALSKTAILGVPVLVIVVFVLSILGVVEIKNKKVLIIPFLVIGVFYFIIDLLEKEGFATSWYIKFLRHPFDAFETRYKAGTGILTETYEIINQNLILGVGPTPIGNAFVGDSMYVNLLYISGIVGALVFLGILISAMFVNLIKRNCTGLLCSIAILLGGFAAPIHLSIVSASLLAYIFSRAELRGIGFVNKKTKNKLVV